MYVMIERLCHLFGELTQYVNFPLNSITIRFFAVAWYL